MTASDLFVDIWARYIRTLTEAPQTLLHGDPHIGNNYVLPDDTVGFLDWQMVRRGNFSLDLGYFLQGALTIADRRNSERDLIEEYRGALELPADELPSAEETWLRYRASVAHGLAIWIATLSGGDAWQRPAWPSRSVMHRRSSTLTPAPRWTPSLLNRGDLRLPPPRMD